MLPIGYLELIVTRKIKTTTQTSNPHGCLIFIGGPGGIRTPDLLVRSQTLYPAELRSHIIAVFNSKAIITKKIWIVNSFY